MYVHVHIHVHVRTCYMYTLHNIVHTCTCIHVHTYLIVVQVHVLALEEVQRVGGKSEYMYKCIYNVLAQQITEHMCSWYTCTCTCIYSCCRRAEVKGELGVGEGGRESMAE